MMEEQKMELSSNSLRVAVAGGGCSGFAYSLNFEPADDTDPLNDEQFESDGIQVRVDRKSATILEGTEIDFHEDLNKRGFAFSNPNATGGCGCGQSFSA